MTRRRVFLALMSLATCLVSFHLPSRAHAQQPASPRRIGVLLVNVSPERKEAQQFRQGLLDAGYVEGRDVVIEWRSASGDHARAPELAADLVQSKVDVIVVVMPCSRTWRAGEVIEITTGVTRVKVGDRENKRPVSSNRSEWRYFQ